MIENYVIESLKFTPMLRYLGYFIFTIGLIALFSYPIYVTFLKFKFRKQKYEIYNVFLKHTPDVYIDVMRTDLGGWLLRMSVAYYPIWWTKRVSKLTIEEIEEWRNGVKEGFGDDYIYYVWYLYITRTVSYVIFPIIAVIVIDMSILS